MFGGNRVFAGLFFDEVLSSQLQSCSGIIGQELTAMGLERVRIAREENLRASDMMEVTAAGQVETCSAFT